MSERELDLRDRPPASRHEAVFEAFESIDPGETLMVVNDHDPSPLLHQMEVEMGSFDAEASTVERIDTNRFEARLEKRTADAAVGSEAHAVDGVLGALRSVTDPDLGMNVVDSGLVSVVEDTPDSGAGASTVTVELETTGVNESTLDGLTDEIEATVRRKTSFENVEIRMTGVTGGSVSIDDVWDRLADVEHPDRTVNVVDAGIISDVEVEGRSVTISVDDPELAGDLDEYRGEFLELVGRAAYNAEGVAEVRVDTGGEVVSIDPAHEEDPPLADEPTVAGPPGAEEPSPLEHESDLGRTAPPEFDLAGIDDIVLVASAKGGVGKTTVATQLARGLATLGQDVGLLDADFAGPDVPQLLGLETKITEGAVVEPIDSDGIQVMSVGLMENRPTAWNGEMIHNALVNLLSDVDWSVDTLVVDLPPGVSDTLMTFLQFVPIGGVLLVTTPFPTSVTDTNDGATLIREGDVPILGVVVNMAGFACPSCGDEHDLFAGTDLESVLDYPILAELPFDPQLRSFSADPPEETTRLAETVVENLPDSGELEVPDDAVDVRGLPEHGRVETVEDAFIALAPGDSLTVVSDRHPAGLAVALLEVMEVDAPPSEAFETYEVMARDSDEWVLRVRKPTDPNGTPG